MLSMLCLVVVFGVHSLIDWTWYVPGDACVALLCAGLAGRPRAARHGEPPRPSAREWRRALARAGAQPDPRSRVGVRGADRRRLLAAWAQWQPQRSEDASQEALRCSRRNPGRARRGGTGGRRARPAVGAGAVRAGDGPAGDGQTASSPERRSSRRCDCSPRTRRPGCAWAVRPERQLHSAAEGAQAALQELGAAIYLNPESIAPKLIADGNPEAITIQNDYIEALRAQRAARSATAARQASSTRRAPGGPAAPLHIDVLEAEVLEQPA